MAQTNKRALDVIHAPYSFNLLRIHQGSQAGGAMNQIAKGLLAEFATNNGLEHLPESEQFEHMMSFLALRRHYSRAFDTANIVTGAGGDTGLDAIAVLVNGMLVTDVDQVDELYDVNGYIEAVFVFVQAERSEHFDSGKILKIGAGVKDFFAEVPALPRNEKVAEAAVYASAVYNHSTHFKKGNPNCIIYYATTGQQADAPEITANIDTVVAELKAFALFGDVQFIPFGTPDIQRLNNQIKYAAERELKFQQLVEIPAVEGVSGAFLGFMTASDFVDLVADDAGDAIRGSHFHDNVRDWQDYNEVNDEMRTTLTSEASERFVLMNNGVTIIARKMLQSGSKFALEDFQIVNGCQTSNVIFDQRDSLNDSVMIPVRLISSDNDDVVRAIVRGTNRQTELRPEQFYALNDFSRSLEDYYRTRPEEIRLYYERRDGQYDQEPITKTKIISPPDQIKSFAAMFLGEPHVATRNYKSLRDAIGDRFFVKEHRLEPYFVAAMAAYHLEVQYRGKIDPAYKSARHHMLLAVRLLMDPKPLPQMNSRDMTRRCNPMIDTLSDQGKIDKLFGEAVGVIDKVSGGNLARDNIRTIGTTNAIIELLEKRT